MGNGGQIYLGCLNECWPEEATYVGKSGMKENFAQEESLDLCLGPSDKQTENEASVDKSSANMHE